MSKLPGVRVGWCQRFFKIIDVYFKNFVVQMVSMKSAWFKNCLLSKLFDVSCLLFSSMG